MEDHERGRDEEQHRRQRVARAHLEQQVLARKCRDVSDVAPHANASRAVASGSRRSGSCVATRNVASPRREASSRSSNSAPSASRAENGSSSRSSSGSWGETRQRGGRRTNPRQNDDTPPVGAAPRPHHPSKN